MAATKKKKNERINEPGIITPQSFQGANASAVPTLKTPLVNPAAQKPAVPSPDLDLPRQGSPSGVVIKNEAGQIKGFENPKGDVFLGASPSLQRASDAGISAAEISQQQFLQNRSQRAMQLIQQYQGQELSPEVLATLTADEVNLYKTFAASGGTAGIAGAGALIGGLAAGIPTGGVGAIPGAIGGAAIGGLIANSALNSARANIKEQLSGNILAKKIELLNGDKLMRDLITDINGGGDPMENIKKFYELETALQVAHEKLKLDTQSDLALFSSEDGTPELARYKLFFREDIGTFAALERELIQAAQNPNPNKILSTSSISDNAAQ